MERDQKYSHRTSSSFIRASKGRYTRVIAPGKLDRGELDRLRQVMLDSNICFMCLGPNTVCRPFIEGMSLDSYMAKQKFEHATLNDALNIAIAICESVEELHRLGIPLHTLKCSNVIIDENGSPNLVDFGLSCLAEDQKSKENTIYMGPELTNGNLEASPLAHDIWCLGVVVYVCLVGRLPWQTRHIPKLLKDVNKCDVVVPVSYPDAVKQLLEKMLTPKLASRPSIQYALRCLRKIKETPGMELIAVDGPASVPNSRSLGDLVLASFASSVKRKVKVTPVTVTQSFKISKALSTSTFDPQPSARARLPRPGKHNKAPLHQSCVYSAGASLLVEALGESIAHEQ